MARAVAPVLQHQLQPLRSAMNAAMVAAIKLVSGRLMEFLDSQHELLVAEVVRLPTGHRKSHDFRYNGGGRFSAG